MTATAVILAAGFGTRMKSVLPKTLHKVAGKPMLRHLIDSCAEVFDRIVVVVGPETEAVGRAAAPWPSVVQVERLGTAHAALQGRLQRLARVSALFEGQIIAQNQESLCPQT